MYIQVVMVFCDSHLGRVLLGPTRLGWVGLVGLLLLLLLLLLFYWESTEPFSVGLVDQLFQPTQNPVEMVENEGYRPLSQLWVLNCCIMSTTKMAVGVWCRNTAVFSTLSTENC